MGDGLPSVKCDPCWKQKRHRAAVGYCNFEGLHWRLCEDHLLSAGACGFYPKRYGDDCPLTPQKAAEIAIKRREVEQ